MTDRPTAAETSPSYFERQWAASDDPWAHATRWYEERKYDLTVAVLPRRRYQHAVEPACGVGLLTARLAARADRVTATDRYAKAVDVTASRCRASGNVDVRVGDVRAGPPADSFDLAVVAEVLYYFDAPTVAAVVQAWHAACAAGGHVVLVHYRPEVAEHLLRGDEVHEIARHHLGPPAVALDDPEFRLDVFAAG